MEKNSYELLSDLITLDNVDRIINKNQELFFKICPELKEIYNLNQNNPYHIYNVYNHTLEVMKNTPNNKYLRWAALFHDIGKSKTLTTDENGVNHFYHHAKYSNEIFNNIALRINIDEETRKIVSFLIINHDNELSKKIKKIRKTIDRYGIDNILLLIELKKADVKGQNPKYFYRLNELEDLKNKYIEIATQNNINFDNNEEIINQTYNENNSILK